MNCLIGTPSTLPYSLHLVQGKAKTANFSGCLLGDCCQLSPLARELQYLEALRRKDVPMKINLNAQYTEISRQLDRAKAQQPSLGDKAPFARFLGDLLDNTGKISIFPGQDQKVPPENVADERGPMARLGLMPPPPSPVTLPRVEPPEIPTPDVNPLTESLDTPEILEARRVMVPRDMSGLRYKEREKVVSDKLALKSPEVGLDPALSMSVVSAESSFNPQAVSKDGYETKGLFQLRDITAKEQLKRMGSDIKFDPFDPDQNIHVGLNYLRYLHDLFREGKKISEKLTTVPAANSSSLEKLAVAAFNAGEGRVASAQARAAKAGLDPANFDAIQSYLPEITQNYVEKVMVAREQYRTEFEKTLAP